MNENNLRIGEYAALHVRRNDFQYKAVVKRRRKSIVKHVTKDNDHKIPILILSDVFDQKLIDIFESKGNRVVCWSQKKYESNKVKSNRVNKFYFATNSKESVVLDMLCATPAMKFYGSPLSTFSSRIYHWRGLLSKCNSKVDDNIYYTMPWNKEPRYWSYVDKNYWKQEDRKTV